MKETVRERIIVGAFVTVLLAGYIAYWLPSCEGGSRWKFGQAVHEERQLLLGMATYQKTFGHDPDGDATAIMNALAGNNPTHILIMHSPRNSTNQAGGWLDPWGTAYEINDAPPVVKSAGPNQKFGDADDIVLDWKKLMYYHKLP
jgi:hypothetical protein